MMKLRETEVRFLGVHATYVAEVYYGISKRTKR